MFWWASEPTMGWGLPRGGARPTCIPLWCGNACAHHNAGADTAVHGPILRSTSAHLSGVVATRQDPTLHLARRHGRTYSHKGLWCGMT